VSGGSRREREFESIKKIYSIYCDYKSNQPQDFRVSTSDGIHGQITDEVKGNEKYSKRIKRVLLLQAMQLSNALCYS
jgi:hypothetical protein